MRVIEHPPEDPVPAIVYLLGYPGVGKYTVGRELARRMGAILIDSQVVNHPILALFNWDGKSQLPEGTFDRAEPIREAVFSALEDIAPKQMSYIFTNVLEDKSTDLAIYERLKGVASRRGSVFVPVMLTCAVDVQLRRVQSQERARRFKIADSKGVMHLMTTTPLYTPDDPELLTIDTTSLAPEQSASRILDSIERRTR